MDRASATSLLAQPTRARLFALLQARDGPVDTVELADAVGLHPNGVRVHLQKLESVGLVTRTRVPQAHGGRLRDRWTVSSGPPPYGPHIAERSRSTREERNAAPAPVPGTLADYRRLAGLRAGLRGYLAWAEDRARDFGLTAAQFQLALVVGAFPDPAGPTLTELADALLLRHHSVVGLVDRSQDAGLVERVRDAQQTSRVHVRLTEHGAERFRALADSHLQQLERLAPHMQELWGAFAPR